jgi:hypothetical protein
MHSSVANKKTLQIIMKKTVETFFEQLELGDYRQHGTATIFPLFSRIEPVVESFRRINAKVSEGCLAASSPVGVATSPPQ